MAEKVKRLAKVAKELNVGVSTIVDFLESKKIEITSSPNAKIEEDSYHMLLEKFQPDMLVKQKKEEAKIQAEKDREEFLKHDIARKKLSIKPKIAIPPTQNVVNDDNNEPEDEVVVKSNVIDNQEKKTPKKQETSEIPVEKEAAAESIPKKEIVEQDKAENKKEEIKPIVEVPEKQAKTEETKPIVSEEIIPEQPKETKLEAIEKPKETIENATPKPPIEKAPIEKATEKPTEKKPVVVENQGDNQEEKQTAKKEDATPGLKVLGKLDLTELDSKKPPKSTINKDSEKQTENKDKPKEEEKSKPVEPKIQTKEERSTSPVAKEEVIKAEAEKTTPSSEKENTETKAQEADKVVGTPKAEKKEEENKLKGLTVLGKIDLDQFKKKKPQHVASTSDPDGLKRKKRKRKKIVNPKSGTGTDTKTPGSNQNTNTGNNQNQGQQRRNTPNNRPNTPPGNRTGGAANNRPNTPGNRSNTDRRGPARGPVEKKELDEKQIQAQIKDTLNRLTNKDKQGNKTKIKRKKKEISRQRAELDAAEQHAESRIIQVTEFITANDLANLMDVSVTEVITACMSLGLMVSINQRIDAETIGVVAEEFGYEVTFKDIEMDEPSLEEPSNEARLTERAPIVTIMGHVDHGKTSLLDYIRKSNVIAGEAGGITQHIGAYEVTLENGKQITFLDTPGHEAFTAMRSRGAKVTDVVIIVVAADDKVMPQTKEAISHAQAAGVPLVFAINKIDREVANPDLIKQQLSELDILVEDWGGKYQSNEISAKTGLNVNDLLEKVLLEAELLELKADPGKRALGTIIESSLDKGKGLVATVLVQNGTLRVGDNILAGAHAGKVKALFNERGQRVKEAGPATPVQVLGFDGATTAGDKFYVTKNESEAKQFANQRSQLIREQGIRTTKHITLDEIGRRIAIGNFKELNVIVKGDVDGSVEALADSLLKLSTEEIQVNVIHKGVGQISETDVLLASASDAIIIGFQVRPSANAKNTAEREQIDIRLYSVIYQAIEELKLAMEGMLEPTKEEKVIATVEIRDTFKISKVGTIAGCYVTSGKINRNSKVRLIREGVVKWEGELASLKRFKDDVKEVSHNYECGLNLAGYNDIKVGDYIEAYEFVEVKRKL